MQKYECIEYNGEKYEYLGNGPTATGAHNGWAMCDTIYFKCISCGYLMSGGSSEYDTCSCGKMHKDVDAGRFGRSDGGDMSVEVFQKAVEINEITPADTFSYKTVTYQPRNNPANLHYFREADMSLFKRKKYEYPLLE
ncbi:MAG: hypothetical protein FWC89_07380, partial [Defluviitaleaceae bacterium]|nr:hypothetical protein [Defluviitaleaceae bacterium]